MTGKKRDDRNDRTWLGSVETDVGESGMDDDVAAALAWLTSLVKRLFRNV